jgi:hypothetical protein
MEENMSDNQLSSSRLVSAYLREMKELITQVHRARGEGERQEALVIAIELIAQANAELRKRDNGLKHRE